MRVLIAMMLLSANVSLAGLTQAQENAAAHQKGDAYHRCISDMTLWVLRRKGEIDRGRIADEILSSCILQAPFTGERAQLDAWLANAKREVEAQIEKDAPRAKAEKAEEDRAGVGYFLCLERHAKMLALSSDEAADVVAQASLSACPAERLAVFEVHRSHNDVWNEGTMKAMENVFVQRLLLEIVATRAQRNGAPAPTPEPTPRKTPI